MAEPKNDLGSESDLLLRRIADLRSLESEKRREPISSARFQELAEAVTAKAREIMYGARDEERSGNDAEPATTSIDDVEDESDTAATAGLQG